MIIKNKFQYNSDFETIYDMSKEEKIKFISDRFSSFVNERQLFSGKQLDGKDITYRNYTLIWLIITLMIYRSSKCGQEYFI